MCKPCRDRRAWQRKHPDKLYEDWLKLPAIIRQRLQLERKLTPGMQTCTDCSLKKPLTEFARIPRTKAGWHGCCRVCQRKRDRERYRSDPNRREYLKQYDKRLRERRRQARMQQIEPT
jgi:hypothetical protein